MPSGPDAPAIPTSPRAFASSSCATPRSKAPLPAVPDGFEANLTQIHLFAPPDGTEARKLYRVPGFPAADGRRLSEVQGSYIVFELGKPGQTKAEAAADEAW